MDHGRYAWQVMHSRAAVQWPGGKPLAVWINVSLEHFPLNPRSEGFKAPGNMSMPYPDLRHYTLRDYGNRVGVFRVLKALADAKLQASFAINGEVAERYPALLRRVAGSGAELVAHGWNMDCVHHGGLPERDEATLIRRCIDALRPFCSLPIQGWLSPARSQSALTPDLLKEAGITWCADWVNDELPYPQHTRAGDLTALPLPLELEDRFIVTENNHAESEYAEPVIDAFEYLLNEAQALGQGRLLALSIHPWVMGQPHRIKHLERVFAHLQNRSALCWNALPSAIVQAAQHGVVTAPPSVQT
jgi:allantoinase